VEVKVMSEYLTGELSDMFGISNRTIQYYDKKGLLKPAYIKENSYRVYTKNEVEKLQLILILKELDISLKDIKVLLDSDKDMKAINLILEQKINETTNKIEQQQSQLKHIQNIKNTITENSNSQIHKLIDIENAMERNDERKDLYKKLFIIGGCATFIQLVGVSISFAIKSYLPFFVSLIIGVICATAITNKYFKAVVYMCPNCHTTFKPKLLKWLFAAHTIKTRKLKCPNCHDKNHCLELIKTP
jgi:DNA-binding transcriptional MerR regulator/DNA-directed RNA polymerase subunit RPC12/RpoP